MPFVGVQIKHPLMLVVIGLLASFAFSSLGTMVGALATRIEHISLITSVIIQPLAFLGGVFYSVGMLPGVLKVVTFFNPIFYTVDAARYVTLRRLRPEPLSYSGYGLPHRRHLLWRRLVGHKQGPESAILRRPR